MNRLRFLPSLIPIGLDIDYVSKDTKTAKEADVTGSKTGWERLKEMFKKDDFGNLSLEIRSIIQVACMSSFIGLVYGGVTHSREAYIDFINNNQATAFKNHLDAKKLLHDKVTLSFAKGGFKWCWRLTSFSTSYVAMSTCIAVYRGKSGIIEHIVAGGFAGFMYKLKMGPRAWLVGGGLGMALGSIAGLSSYGLLCLTGMTIEEVRYWNYQWIDKRNQSFNEAIKMKHDKEKIKLLQERELKLGNTKTVIDLGTEE